MLHPPRPHIARHRTWSPREVHSASCGRGPWLVVFPDLTLSTEISELGVLNLGERNWKTSLPMNQKILLDNFGHLTMLDNLRILDNIWQFKQYWIILKSFDNLDNFDNFDNIDNFLQFFLQFCQFCKILTILTIMTKTILLVTCDVWDTDYNSDN